MVSEVVNHGAQAAQKAGGSGRVCAIVGGGIVGASAAYYLKSKGVKTVVIEQTEIACHSSGKAGGFLSTAMPGGSISALAEASFALHKELADTFGADKIGYRRMKCIGTGIGKTKLKGNQSWLDKTNGSVHIMGDETNTAQVHPRLLTETLVRASEAQIVRDKATEVVQDDNMRVTGVMMRSGEFLPCDYLIVAMGAWSQESLLWFPGLQGTLHRSVGPMYSSIVVDKVLDNTAVFISGATEVEIYPRPDETYICGHPRSVISPDVAMERITKNDATDKFLLSEVSKITSTLDGVQIKQSQRCCLPISADGDPVIGPIPGVSNGFIGCGLGCWGILNGPATGKILADLVVEGQSSIVDIAQFSPDR